MKRARVLEYARMVLGPVRFADPETRAERHSKPADPTKDATKIAQSQRFTAADLAKSGYLSPWKQKLARLLKL